MDNLSCHLDSLEVLEEKKQRLSQLYYRSITF